MTQNPIQPLSVGNVISASLRLYRSRFQSYLGLSIKAILWALVPIYGWAKSYAIGAQISRLVFSELVNQPESVKNAYSHVNSRMWSLLVTKIIVGLILLATNIGLAILTFIVIFVPTLILSSTSSNNTGAGLFLLLLQIVVRLASLIAQLWIQSRFFIAELPLVIEPEVDSTKTISRSWELTQGFVGRIQLILFVGYLITLPLIGLAVTPLILIIPFFVAASKGAQDSIVSLIFLGVIILLILVALAIIVTLPFWQSIKAIIYYDLRSRREGLGLQLRAPGFEL